MVAKWFKKEAGATLVEATLVAGLLISFAFGILEFGRYYYYKATLLRAANNGLELSIRHADILIDSTEIDMDKTTSDNSAPAERLKAVIDEIERRVLTQIDLERDLVGAATTRVAVNQNITTNYSNASATGEPPLYDLPPSRVLVIRPGDRGRYLDPATNTVIEVVHPTYPERQNGDDFLNILQEHPILIEINARMASVIPLFPNIPIRVQAVGIPEIITRGIQGVPAEQELIDPFCGDNVYHSTLETCDIVDGVSMGVDPGHFCTTSCEQEPLCGNGIVDDGEDCDGWLVREGLDDLEEGLRECGGDCKIREIEPCGNGRWEKDEPFYEECDASASESLTRNVDEYLCVQCKWYDITECLFGSNRISEPCLDQNIPAGFECINCVLCECDKDPETGAEDCSNCKAGKCGNGIKEAGEQCDRFDGTSDSSEFCNDCRLVKALCGNKIREELPGRFDGDPPYIEKCDIGAPNNPDIPASHVCSENCTIASLCHNNKVDNVTAQFPGDTDYSEECDGNAVIPEKADLLAQDDHECRDCAVLPRCGNGRIDKVGSHVEECDGSTGAPEGGYCDDECKKKCNIVAGVEGTLDDSGRFCVSNDIES